MSTRPSVPQNVQKMLWSESMGHCMNPGCHAKLIECGTNVSEMAHIVPHAQGGDVCPKNLILLCRKCHKQIDYNATEATISKLKEWKSRRSNELQKRFTRKYASYHELARVVVPVLERNSQIFDSYGPNSNIALRGDSHKLWLQFEHEIIANNKILELVLTENIEFLHVENKDVVKDFVTHAREFVETRGPEHVARIKLFPAGLLSAFGIKENLVGLPPNVSALQNFLSRLINEDRFVDFQLTPDQYVTYKENGKTLTMNLKDRHRVQQIFFAGGFYRPATTDLRLQSLVFLLERLDDHDIRYEFKEVNNLTEIIVNQHYKLRLFYKYCLSVSDLHSTKLNENDIVINLHNWNGAPVSSDAYDYASRIGAKIFPQNEFFVFAYNNLK